MRNINSFQSSYILLVLYPNLLSLLDFCSPWAAFPAWSMKEALVLKCHHTLGNSGIWDDTVNKFRSVCLCKTTGVMASVKMLQCSIIKSLHLV